MCEVIAESVQKQSDGSLWAITVQTTDDDVLQYEIESQVKEPGDLFLESVDVIGPFKHLMDAVEEAERVYRGHKLLLV